MAKVVIMGAGIGGVSRAYEIRAGLEPHFKRNVRAGSTDPVHEKFILKMMGIEKLKS